MAMLEIRGVHKSFHTYAKPGVHPGIFGRAPKPTSSLDVLRGVDLTVEKGDVVAILGPSGSGKTTLLRCLNFLETADAGQLTFDGETFDLAHADRASIARLRRKTAFVFQNYNLFRNKTALQNVTEGLIVARKMPKAEADAVGMKMLEKVGLADRADYYPRQLSGGQQQRVAIARALVTNPAIICMDEPLSNLDAKLRVQLRNELKKMQKDFGITTIYVTHDQVEAMTMGDYIAVMKDGVIMQYGTPDEIYTDPQNIFTARFIGEPGMNIAKRPDGMSWGFRSAKVQFQEPSDFHGCVFRGTVLTRERLGDIYHYTISGENGDEYAVRSVAYFDFNEKVSMYIRQEDLYLFDANGDRVRELDLPQPQAGV